MAQFTRKVALVTDKTLEIQQASAIAFLNWHSEEGTVSSTENLLARAVPLLLSLIFGTVISGYAASLLLAILN